MFTMPTSRAGGEGQGEKRAMNRCSRCVIPDSRREGQRLYKQERATRLRCKPLPALTHARLLYVIHYDPESGAFTRIGRSGKRTDLIGAEAGGPTSDGYLRIAVDDRRYRAHRLAWFYMTGQWPKPEVDHKNTLRIDNRWQNLRLATSTINKENRRKANSNSAIGLLGVSKRNDKFAARITVNRKERHLGVFDTPEQAHATYVAAKRELHEGGTL